MANSTAILPKGRSLAKPMRVIISNTLSAQAKAIKVDLALPAATWDHKVNVAINAPTPYERQITVDDEIYAMLNAGTRAHDIKPRSGGILRFRTPFRAKTVPDQIRSNKGALGNVTVWSHGVHHPGTRARNWDRVIGKKWRERIGDIFQRSIDAAIK